MSFNTDDRQIIVQADEDQTEPEPWQPDDATSLEAGSYEALSYIPMSTDISTSPRPVGQYDEWGHELPGYSHEYSGHNDAGYSHAPSSRTTADNKFPPNKNHNRPRWGTRSEPYQTPATGHYHQPNVNAHPGVHHESSANHSTHSNNIVVVQPGNSSNPVITATHLSNNTALSVFVTVLCCLPLGLCAFFYARDSQTMWMLGYTDEAVRRSTTSRNLNIAGIIIGLLLITGSIILIFVRI